VLSVGQGRPARHNHQAHAKPRIAWRYLLASAGCSSGAGHGHRVPTDRNQFVVETGDVPEPRYRRLRTTTNRKRILTWVIGPVQGSHPVYNECSGDSEDQQWINRVQKARSEYLCQLKPGPGKPRIIILLLMVASVTVASDPILVLGPALSKHVFHASADWSAYFIVALGAGSIAGSLLPRRGEPAIRRAAVALGVLGLAMVGFAAAPRIWLSMIAAFVAGVACLVANSATRALLIEQAGRQHVVSVMAVWAIAWAGSKPIASLVDGLMAGSRIGVRHTGILLAVPTLLPALIMLCWPVRRKRHIPEAVLDLAT
jgi:hypothetical protein